MKSDTVFGRKKDLAENLKLPEDFQGLPEGKRIISQDWKNRDGTIAKRFRCKSLGEIRTLVRDLSSRNRANLYEILHEWKKCKLYFDVDVTPDRLPEGKTKEDLFSEFPVWLEDCVRRYFGLQPTTPVSILQFDSSRPDKISLHAHVMDVCAPNPKTVKWLVVQMIAEECWMSKFLDPVPYGKFQNWRLPLCCKFGKDNKKMPIWTAAIQEVPYEQMLVSVTDDKMHCVPDKNVVDLPPTILAITRDYEDGLRPADINTVEGFHTDLWMMLNDIPNGGQGQGFKVRDAVMKACGNAAVKYHIDGRAHFLKWLSNRRDFSSRQTEWARDYDRYLRFISRLPVGTLKVYDHIQKYADNRVFNPTFATEEFESDREPLSLSSSDVMQKLWMDENQNVIDCKRNIKTIAQHYHSVIAACGSQFIRKTGPCQWKREAKFPALDRVFEFSPLPQGMGILSGKSKTKKLKDIWNKEGPPEYTGLVFDPLLPQEEAKKRKILQTFRGYPIIYRARDLLFDETQDNEEFLKQKSKPFLDLLTRIANDVDDDAVKKNLEYLLNYLAWLLQKPGQKIPKAIYIEGPQGSGKSAFAKLLECLFAPYFLSEKGLDFFERRFNVELDCVSVLFLDEAQGTGGNFNIRGLTGKAKEVITGHRMQMEQKFFDPITLKNHISVIMATDQVGKLHMEMDDRRIVKFKILDGKTGWNTEFYNAVSDENLVAHFALLLLERDLSQFDPQKQHETTWNKHARLGSLSVPARALKNLLNEKEKKDWTYTYIPPKKTAEETCYYGENKGRMEIPLDHFIDKYGHECSIRAKKNIDPVPLAFQACKELGLSFDPQTQMIHVPKDWTTYFEKLVTGQVRSDFSQ